MSTTLPTSDEQLDRWISEAWKNLNYAASEPARREAAARMKELIGLRTPQRVGHMEREQGLR